MKICINKYLILNLKSCMNLCINVTLLCNDSSHYYVTILLINELFGVFLNKS